MFRKSRGKVRDVEVEIVRPGDVDRPRQPREREVRKREPSRPISEAPAAPARPPREREVSRPQALRPVPEPLAAPALPPRPPRIEQRPPAEETEEARAAPAPRPTELTCEILFWRGYRKGAFYARIFDDEGEPLAVAESPFFRSRGNGIPERTEGAAAAYEELRDQLEREGWQHVADGETWFGDTFRRPVTDAEEPAPA